MDYNLRWHQYDLTKACYFPPHSVIYHNISYLGSFTLHWLYLLLMVSDHPALSLLFEFLFENVEWLLYWLLNVPLVYRFHDRFSDEHLQWIPVSVSLFQPLRSEQKSRCIKFAKLKFEIYCSDFILDLQSVSCLLKGSCLALKRH
jgi:hypothetical protein